MPDKKQTFKMESPSQSGKIETYVLSEAVSVSCESQPLIVIKPRGNDKKGTYLYVKQVGDELKPAMVRKDGLEILSLDTAFDRYTTFSSYLKKEIDQANVPAGTTLRFYVPPEKFASVPAVCYADKNDAVSKEKMKKNGFILRVPKSKNNCEIRGVEIPAALAVPLE